MDPSVLVADVLNHSSKTAPLIFFFLDYRSALHKMALSTFCARDGMLGKMRSGFTRRDIVHKTRRIRSRSDNW